MKKPYKYFKLLILRAIVIFIISILLTNCSKHQARIGFLLPNLTLSRYQKEQVIFTNKVKASGGSVTVLSANDNDNLQINQAEELIAKGVDVLVVCAVNASTSATIVRMAHKKDIPVIGYDRVIHNCDLDYLLTFDNEMVGYLMAEYVKNLKPNGKYILLGGDRNDQNAIWVKNGQLKSISSAVKSAQINIIYDCYTEDWSGGDAKHQIKKFLELSLETPDVILSSNDGMATSVIELLKELNLNKKVLITGQDADIEACRNIMKGNQIMTVYKPLRLLANKAAEMALQIAGGEKVKDKNASINNGKINVPTVLLKPTTVDLNNIKETVIADGFLTEAEINQ